MPPYTPTRRDWLLLTAAGAFKFTLVGFTLVAVMTMLKTYGYTLEQLSWVFLLGSVEAAKVLFAIVIERYCPARGGRFRFWLLVSLVGIAASLVLLMLLDPRRHFFLLLPVLFVLSCFSVLFGSASVGLGSLLLPYRARGHGGVIQVVAARAGKMIGGAGVLWIFQQYGWTSAIAATLAFTFAVLLQTAAYREPEAFRQPAFAWRLSNLFKRLALFWRDTPRGKTWFALLFASCIPYAATATTFTPELTDLGWTPKQIGTVLTAVIPLACMAATPAAGLLARKYSRRGLMSVLLAVQVPVLASLAFAKEAAALHPMLPAVQIGLLNIGYTLLLPVVMAAIMDKSRPEYAALDNALQLSIMLAGTYAAGFAALRLAHKSGYPAVHLCAAAAGAIVCFGVWRWFREDCSSQ